MRPSPQPKSYTVSPGLILAISSIRSTTCVGDATYGASLLTYLASWEKPGTARSASRTALAQRITYLNGGLMGLIGRPPTRDPSHASIVQYARPYRIRRTRRR